MKLRIREIEDEKGKPVFIIERKFWLAWIFIDINDKPAAFRTFKEAENIIEQIKASNKEYTI